MRYYDIQVLNSDGTIYQEWTSFVNGKTDLGALQIDFDIPVYALGQPAGAASLKIMGIPVTTIAQSANFNDKLIKVYGGFKPGLPLATLASKNNQSGLLLQGQIWQAFGNWIDTDQTLDLVIMPGASATSSSPGGIGTLAAPRNLVLNWKTGQSFSDAVKSTLSTAFPGSTVTVNVSSSIVRPNDEVGFFPTLEQFAQYARQTSLDIVKTAGYAGVTIVPGANSFNVFDGSQGQNTQKQIAFEDLIGQPTWIEAPNISIKTVMRADPSVGDSISLPQTITTNSQAALSSQVNQQVAFQGGFQIVSARHVGNFRQPSADAWVSVFEGAPLQQAAAQ